MYSKEELIFKIGIAVVLLGLVAALVFGLVHDKLEDQRYTQKQEELAKAALPYEMELSELQIQLARLNDNFDYSPSMSHIMAAFAVSEPSDIDYIRGKAKTYKFSPVIVIDCMYDSDKIFEIMKAVDDEWEIMLYADDFTTAKLYSVMAAKNQAKALGKSICDIFFLRNGYETAENMDALNEAGFGGYTLYHEYPEAGQSADDSVHFDYSYITANNTPILERLTLCQARMASMVAILDMYSIRSGNIFETTVDKILDKITELARKNSCSFSTVKAAVAELSVINETIAQNRAEYEVHAAPIKARMEELRLIIDAIYYGA